MNQEVAYFEIPPNALLSRHIECFWYRCTARSNDFSSRHLVLPDGCMDILFSQNSAGRASLRIIGTMTVPLQVRLLEQSEFVGIRFRPGHLRRFLDLNASEVTDSACDMADIFRHGDESTLREGLFESKSLRGKIDKLEQFLLSRLDQAGYDVHIEDVCGRMTSEPEALSIDALVKSDRISRQYLARRFRDFIGISPKRFLRIMRFRRALAKARTQKIRWVDLAHDMGYYDQSHFINEFAEFTGLTPDQYFSGYSSH